MHIRALLPCLALFLIFAAPASADPQSECYARCADEFDQCDLFCDPYGGPNGCDACYDRLDECNDSCDQCPVISYRQDPPVLVSSTPLGQTLCLKDDVSSPVQWAPNHLFAAFDNRYRRTTTRVTQNCDGSVTYQVVQTAFENRTCFRDTEISCGFSSGNASSYCIF